MTTTTKSDQMYDDKRDVTKNSVVPEDESAVMMVPQPEPPDQSKHRRFSIANKPLPALDGGYAWVIMGASFFMHFILGGWRRSYSLMLIEIKEQYGTSTGVAAWIGGCASSAIHLLSPISALLVHRFSTRAVVMFGGALVSISSLLSAFAPKVEMLFFTYSFLTGFGGACLLSPSLVLVSQYFDKRRSLASGLACSGGGFGGFIFPIVLEYLFLHMSYSGCLMVMAGVLLHLCISGAVHRSLEDHYRGSRKVEHITQAPPLQIAQPPPEPDSSSSTSTSYNCLEKITHSAIYAELQYVLTLRFIVFTSALGISLGVLVVNWILLTAYAVDRGVSLTNAVLLSSIGAMTDTVGRILSGFLFDISFFKRFRVQTFNFILLLNGAVMLGLAFAYHYYMMVALVMLSYVCSAVMTSQRQVILVDLFGVETLPTTLPFTLAMQGVGLMFIPALCGFMCDVTGSYTIPYLIACGFGILSCFLFSLVTLTNVCCPKKSKESPASAAPPIPDNVV